MTPARILACCTALVCAGGCCLYAAARMGIDWAKRKGLANAIPPAYTEFIGAQLLEHVGRVAA